MLNLEVSSLSPGRPQGASGLLRGSGAISPVCVLGREVQENCPVSADSPGAEGSVVTISPLSTALYG